MQYKASTFKEYVDQLPDERKVVLKKLRQVIKRNIPKGFKETIGYSMPAWVVPHSKYPAGYHCDPELPLPFMNIASQKNFVALYHLGIYADPILMKWWTEEFPKHASRKLDMGKSCVRFKKMDDIPYDLIGELAGKMTLENWVDLYKSKVKR